MHENSKVKENLSGYTGNNSKEYIEFYVISELYLMNKSKLIELIYCHIHFITVEEELFMTRFIE